MSVPSATSVSDLASVFRSSRMNQGRALRYCRSAVGRRNRRPSRFLACAMWARLGLPTSAARARRRTSQRTVASFTGSSPPEMRRFGRFYSTGEMETSFLSAFLVRDPMRHTGRTDHSVAPPPRQPSRQTVNRLGWKRRHVAAAAACTPLPFSVHERDEALDVSKRRERTQLLAPRFWISLILPTFWQ